jgi:hypothetical protein
MRISSLTLVIPAKAGIPLSAGSLAAKLDSRLRGNDGVGGGAVTLKWVGH